MYEYVYNTLKSWEQLAFYLAGFFVLFSTLAYYMPCNKNQPVFHNGMVDDLLYGLLLPLVSQFVNIVFLALGFGIFFYNVPQEQLQDYVNNGHGYLRDLPLWLQASMVFMLSDILLYWTHRFFHTPTMWRWHAIHHSPKIVDWLTSYRFHPVNVWLSFTLVNVVMLLLGFSPASIAVMSGFNMAFSFMVHANLNWTFGPFRYVIASPVFHRWHHTTQKEGLDKNFAPTFPLLDIMFGTFYMPEGKLPETFGINGTEMPESFLRQLVWPFKKENQPKKGPKKDKKIPAADYR